MFNNWHCSSRALGWFRDWAEAEIPIVLELPVTFSLTIMQEIAASLKPLDSKFKYQAEPVAHKVALLSPLYRRHRRYEYTDWHHRCAQY